MLKTFFWLCTLFTMAFSVTMCTHISVSNAQSWYDDTYAETFEGIVTVSPHVEDRRAHELTFLIIESALEYELDPLLLVAMIRRESNFLRSVEQRRLFGSAGEVGLMQIQPGEFQGRRYITSAGMRFRPTDCTPYLRTARCQVQTGAAFLAFIRDMCGGSKTRWVASYGMSRCAREGEMDTHISVVNVIRYYEQASGRSWYSGERFTAVTGED